MKERQLMKGAAFMLLAATTFAQKFAFVDTEYILENILKHCFL